jgi:hypothetical protein
MLPGNINQDVAGLRWDFFPIALEVSFAQGNEFIKKG